MSQSLINGRIVLIILIESEEDKGFVRYHKYLIFKLIRRSRDWSPFLITAIPTGKII